MKLNHKWVALGAMAAFAAFAPSASAQTTGTVTMSGNVAAAVKLTAGGAATLAGNSGGGVTVPGAADAALATIVDFGDVGPANTNAVVCFTQPLFLRANATSRLHALLSASAFGGGVGDIAATDVRLGFINLSDLGNAQATVATSTVAAGYGVDVCAAAGNTLNNIIGGAPGVAVLSNAGPISTGGNFNAVANRIGLDMRLAIVPQAYTAGVGFNATVTLTMTTP